MDKLNKGRVATVGRLSVVSSCQLDVGVRGVKGVVPSVRYSFAGPTRY
jgi:hypothetical protein